MQRTEVLIIGAGMGGCSVAFHVAPFASVLVLEAGSDIAQEGAAQNAGLIRRMDPEPCDRALAQRTHRFLDEHAPQLGMGRLSRRTGAVLASVRDPLWLHDARAHLVAEGVRVEPTSPDHFPALKDAPIVHAWHLPDEWVTDGPALASALLAHAIDQGARLATGRMVTRLMLEGGRCVVVMTKAGPIHAEVTVLACGAWSGQLGAAADLHRPLIPLRRMAAVMGPDPKISQHPWCWLDDVGLYAKPHAGGWLISPCDERPDTIAMGASSTGVPAAEQWALLTQKIDRYMPALAALGPTKSWTGLRTFCPDRRPMLGPDKACPGLFWAAGLGGSGVSSCIGVGEFVASSIQGKTVDWLYHEHVAPHRPQLRRWPIFPSGDPKLAKLLSN